MSEAPIHAFLAGRGRDGSGRLLSDVLAFDDARIEGVHDFIQWCFPLAQASRAVPGAPVLEPGEVDAIRRDPLAQDGLRAAAARMARFYADTSAWLTPHDHNHLRITRILGALRTLAGEREADAFHTLVIRRNGEAGSLINADSLAFWERALHR